VQKWLQDLIGDKEVLLSAKIDIPLIMNIIAQTGATASVIGKLSKKPASYEKNLLDIGVFRFPDATHPHIQVRRLHLFRDHSGLTTRSCTALRLLRGTRLRVSLWFRRRKAGSQEVRCCWTRAFAALPTSAAEFYTHKFSPRKTVIDKLSPEIKEKVEQEARELFG
jgi:hypothetical protein